MLRLLASERSEMSGGPGGEGRGFGEAPGLRATGSPLPGDNVITRIDVITGLSVTEVNVAVNDLHFQGDEESSTRVS